MLNKHLVFIGIILLSISSLSAQEIGMRELSKNQNKLKYVYDLKIDDDGLLQIASDKGLFMYDGFQFSEIDIKTKAENNFVSAITKGRKSDLVGFFNGSINDVKGKKIDLQIKSKVVAIIELEGHHFVFGQYGTIYELDANYEAIDTTVLAKEILVNEVQIQHGLIYIATNKGLYVYNFRSSKLVLKKFLFPNDNIRTVYVNNRIYAATSNKIKHSSLMIGEMDEIDITHIIKGEINAIVVEGNRILIGTTKGLYDAYTFEDSYFLAGKKEYENGTEFNVTKLYFSKNGDVFAGTYGLGVWGIPSPTFYFIPNTQIDNSKINCISQFNGMTFLFGGNNGISTYSGGIRSEEEFMALNQLKGKKVTALAANSSGTYIGTEAAGLWLLKKDKSIQLIDAKIKSIEDIATDSSANIWISTSFAGLYCYNGRSTIHFSENSNLIRNDLSAIELNYDKLWFVNGDDGIGFVGLDDSVVTIPANVPLLKYIDFKIDKEGEIWAATEGDGLINISGSNYSLINLEKVSGTNYSNSILIDSKQNIWLTNQDAILNWKQNEELSSVLLGENFELIFRNRAAYAIPSIDWLIYGTESGILYFNTSLIKKYSNKDFYFEINNVPHSVDEEIVLNFSDQIDLNFRYSDIVNNALFKYNYRILQNDTSWIYLEKNSMTINNLSYGDYVLEIKAVNDDGLVYKTNRININIQKPFWLQWWFIALITLIVLITLILLIRYRIRKLKHGNLQLQKIVNQRTAEISRKNKKLEQFAYAVSHDLKNPVINIIGLIDLLDQKKAVKDREALKVFDMLKYSSTQLEKLIKGLVELLRVRSEGEVEIEEVFFNEVFEEVKSAISLQITESKATIQTNFSALESVEYNKTYLHSIFYNLLSNAIKYRDNYRPLVISIQSFKTEISQGFYIEDSGLGMDLDVNKDKLFKMFQRFHDHVEGTGVGLHLINEIVESQGGKIEVESQLRVGTKFEVFLKKAN